jgi:dihydroneopterin aldolase
MDIVFIEQLSVITTIGVYDWEQTIELERVAEEVAELLLNKFNSPWVRIKLSKPGAVARATNVGVIIERGHNLKGSH